jgi:hypothetical protein
LIGFGKFWQICHFLQNQCRRLSRQILLVRDFLLRVASHPHAKDAFVARYFGHYQRRRRDRHLRDNGWPLCFLKIRGQGAARADPAIHYAPIENLEHIDVALIDTAKREIDLAAYVLTDWPVIQALTRAASQGRSRFRPSPRRWRARCAWG